MAEVVGIILAAGLSSRMGRHKALLRCPPSGHTFVAQIVTSFRTAGLDGIAVVGRAGDEPLRIEVERVAPAVHYCVNPAPDAGQFSSLLIGLDAAERQAAAGALVLPVDMPLVSSATVRRIVSVFHESDEAVIRATHRGRHGHPVIFRSSLFDELRCADPSQGARAVVRRLPSRVRDVEVDDPGVLRDFDRPEDYRGVFGRDPG